MKTVRTFVVCATLAILGVFSAPGEAQSPQGAATALPSAPGFTLSSTAFQDGTIIPAKYTQLVPNPVSPALQWTNVSPNTVSFVLIFHDLDGVMNKKLEDYLHWMAFNIPGSARELPENVPAVAQLPDGTVQAKNTRGDVGYRAPGAGPAGPYHHYTFEIYGLDTKLDLGPDATRADVLKAMEGHILGKGVLSGRFHR